MLSPDPLDDLRSNKLISTQSATLKQPSLTNMLFWQWVRFDDSDRRYRLLQELHRQHSSSYGSFVYSSNGFSSVYSLGEVSSSSDISMLGIADTGASGKHHSERVNRGLQPSSANRSYGSTEHSNTSHVPAPTHPNNATRNPTTTITATDSTHAAKNSTSNATHPTYPAHITQPITTPGNDSFWSPGGREYVLEEDREDELELEKLAEEICLPDRDNE